MQRVHVIINVPVLYIYMYYYTRRLNDVGDQLYNYKLCGCFADGRGGVHDGGLCVRACTHDAISSLGRA